MVTPPTQLTAITNDRVELECFTTGRWVCLCGCGHSYILAIYLYRPVPEMTWNKDGVDLSDNGRISLSQFGRILTISSLISSDMGVYECVARQPAGASELLRQTSTTLNVIGEILLI